MMNILDVYKGVVSEKESTDISKNMKHNFNIYVTYLKSNLVSSEDTFGTTYQTYFNNMKLFLEYLSKYMGDVDILSPEIQDNFTEIWEGFCQYCFSKGNNRRTVLNKKTAVCSFFDWCVRRRKILYNPFIYVDKMKVTESDKRRESYFLTPQQIWEIKYIIKLDTKQFDLQDRLLFNLFLDSGCRISEVHSLKIKQLDMDSMIFTNVRHKEGYIEDVLFFEETRELIREWLKYRKDNKIESEFLFLTYYNKKINQMSKETIRSKVKKMGKIVGIDNFYPHSIRKTILNITGQQSESIASALGHHKNMDVTVKHYMKKKKLSEMRSNLEHIRNISGL